MLDSWSDGKLGKNLAIIFAVLIIALSIFLATNVQIQKSTFYYLGAMGILILVAAQTKGGFIKANFFGDNKTRLYMFTGLGLAIGIMLGFTQIQGRGMSILPSQALYLGDMQLLFTNVIAPLVEPMFWRGIVFPSIVAISIAYFGKNKNLAIIVALLLSAYSFGFYHVNVYSDLAQQNSPNIPILDPTTLNMSIAALFAVFYTLGNSIAKTIGFEIGWHFANNLFSQAAGGAIQVVQIIPTILVAGVVFVIVVEFADRLR